MKNPLIVKLINEITAAQYAFVDTRKPIDIKAICRNNGITERELQRIYQMMFSTEVKRILPNGLDIDNQAEIQTLAILSYRFSAINPEVSLNNQAWFRNVLKGDNAYNRKVIDDIGNRVLLERIVPHNTLYRWKIVDDMIDNATTLLTSNIDRTDEDYKVSFASYCDILVRMLLSQIRGDCFFTSEPTSKVIDTVLAKRQMLGVINYNGYFYSHGDVLISVRDNIDDRGFEEVKADKRKYQHVHNDTIVTKADFKQLINITERMGFIPSSTCTGCSHLVFAQNSIFPLELSIQFKKAKDDDLLFELR